MGSGSVVRRLLRMTPIDDGERQLLQATRERFEGPLIAGKMPRRLAVESDDRILRSNQRTSFASEAARVQLAIVRMAKRSDDDRFHARAPFRRRRGERRAHEKV